MKESSINYLVERYLSQQISPEELAELYERVREHPGDAALKQALADNWLRFETSEKLSLAAADIIFNGVLQQAEGLHAGKAKVIRLTNWKRMVAAAAILIAMLTATFWLLRDKKETPDGSAKVDLPADIQAPATNRATITLANGKQVFLDSVSNGALASQDNVQLMKLADGQIAYTGSTQEVIFNTLTNPRGSKIINMTLSDGSRVWLNAGSSVTFPVVFTGNKREVAITGEAYFEIQHNAAKPFIVSKGTARVEVLGTHFNVNAYDDEPDIRVTLLEGSVRLTQSLSPGGNAERVTLRPGQQGIASIHSPLTTDNSPDIEAVMAWKNGVFQLKGNDIETIMRQIARWYDVDVVYSGGPVKQVFYGTIPRTVSTANLFKVLEETGGVHFVIEGRKVTVRP